MKRERPWHGALGTTGTDSVSPPSEARSGHPPPVRGAKRPTQRSRLPRALLAAGPRGVATTDFLAPNVIDGGLPILRVPSRVDELRQRGHLIETTRASNRTAVYVLRGPAVSSAPELDGGRRPLGPEPPAAS